VTGVAIPNTGPGHADSGGTGFPVIRRGNPAPVLRDEGRTDEVLAASGRASTVTHRFGGTRYALTRRDVRADELGTGTDPGDGRPLAEEGDSDASH
jgi:hypothetical protein